VHDVFREVYVSNLATIKQYKIVYIPYYIFYTLETKNGLNNRLGREPTPMKGKKA
jgi:hypothetical protein